jgi:hypothetical protein
MKLLSSAAQPLHQFRRMGLFQRRRRHSKIIKTRSIHQHTLHSQYLKQEHVVLQIYDRLGRAVETLVDGAMSQGTQR